jgi:adenosine deaminase
MAGVGFGMADWRLDLFRSMPKVELHLHLDGALEVKSALDLAEKAAPETFAGLGYEGARRRLVIGGPLASQSELLAYYDLPLRLLQSEEGLARVTDDLFRAKAADRVRYCEIRWAPRLHTRGALNLRQAADCVIRSTARAARRTGVAARLIAVAMRSDSPSDNLDMLRQVAAADSAFATDSGRAAGAGRGLVTAVDLAGPEEAHPDPAAQKPFFDEARRLGFFITLHCGELPDSAAGLRRAVELLSPARVAHGSGAAADPGLCRLLAERGIQLDLCPTSNIQAGLYRDYADFPLAVLYERGVPISVSTDSPVISGRSLSEEYFCLARAGQLSAADLWRVNLRSIDRIFAPEALKRKLRREFSGWARTLPELRGDWQI